MANREEMSGRWNEISGRLKERWGQLTDNDLQRAKGSTDQLVGVVQQKTGAARKEIEEFIDGLFDNGMLEKASQSVQHYGERAQQMASDAGEYMRDQGRRMSQHSGDFSAKLSQTVRDRPTQSLAIVFGLGVVAGAVFFLGRNR